MCPLSFEEGGGEWWLGNTTSSSFKFVKAVELEIAKLRKDKDRIKLNNAGSSLPSSKVPMEFFSLEGDIAILIAVMEYVKKGEMNLYQDISPQDFLKLVKVK